MKKPCKYAHMYHNFRCNTARILKNRYRIFIRNKHKKDISLILVLIWMVFIFVNSAMTGSMSSKFSLMIINAMETVAGWIGLGKIAEEIKQTIQLDVFHMFVLNMAHFVEFGILALLLVNWLKRLDKLKGTYWHIAGIAFLISAIYAVTDEVHQLFVPGRVFSVWDILIDSAGALLFATLAYRHYRRSQIKVRR